MEKSYKYRIYPSAEQEAQIQKTFGCVRYVYNYYLALRKELYEKSGKNLNYYECCKDLTKLKHELAWLCDADVTALQSSVRNLDDSFQNFFRGFKGGKRVGYPKFKRKRNHYQSYKSKNTTNTIRFGIDCVRLPKLGLVPAAISRPIEGRILSATVSQTPSGKYYASICCTDVEQKPYEPTGAVVGIDLGIKELCITSDDQHFPNPKYLAKSQKKLSRLQRRLSRKPKGSHNHEKARVRVARAYEKVTNQRNDAQHKLTTKLVKDYDVICAETLRPSNMVRNHKFARSVSDAGFGEFMRQLEYKCAWYGKALSRVDPFFPSSQLCGVCGTKNPAVKNLKIRAWDCPSCGAHHDRDVNAARNILNEGLRLLA